jgi:hypothetical protein
LAHIEVARLRPRWFDQELGALDILPLTLPQLLLDLKEKFQHKYGPFVGIRSERHVKKE